MYWVTIPTENTCYKENTTISSANRFLSPHHSLHYTGLCINLMVRCCCWAPISPCNICPHEMLLCDLKDDRRRWWHNADLFTSVTVICDIENIPQWRLDQVTFVSIKYILLHDLPDGRRWWYNIWICCNRPAHQVIWLKYNYNLLLKLEWLE